jgi:transposase
MIPEKLADQANELTAMARETIGELGDLLCDLDRRIAIFDKEIEAVFKASEVCQRIAKIKGVGPQNRHRYCGRRRRRGRVKNGRCMAA